MTQPSFANRAAGLLLHPTSLPGHLGSGDLGPAAFGFVEFLADAGMTWWQMLPVNPPGALPGVSPYSSTSAFAGSPFLISLDALADEKLLDRADAAAPGNLNGDSTTQFAEGFAFRFEKLRKAFDRFESHTRDVARRRAFNAFCKAKKSWLADWSLYAALRESHDGAPWYEWPLPIRLREPHAMAEATKTLAREIRFHQFIQFIFDKQWRALRDYANSRGVKFIGDLPIFIAHDSADVWAHRDLFVLDAKGMPKTVTGYPADPFSPHGQTWNHPHYRWPAHQAGQFKWWIARFRELLNNFDGMRIDHFLGFDRAWHIPFGAKDAVVGRWVKAPGRKLFAAIRRHIPKANILIEDLGHLTPTAAKLRDECGFPGMRVLQFGFNEGAEFHLPHDYERNCIAYTGTHDNETFVGWAKQQESEHCNPGPLSKRKRVGLKECRTIFSKLQSYLNNDGADSMHIPAIRAVMASVANTAIVPVQDVLGLDNDSRMNIPGTDDDNWNWRLRDGQLKPEHAEMLLGLAETFGRAEEKNATAEMRRTQRKDAEKKKRFSQR